jgi:O-methyltransferase domain/Dimerisation domain
MTASPRRAPAGAELLEMIVGFQVSRAICAAAELGIADLLADGPKTVPELAGATGTRPPLLYRLLRALASRGIFAEDDDGRFGMTALAEPLRSDAPGGSVRAYALFVGQPFNQRPWEELVGTLRTGEPGFDRAYGISWFDYLSGNAGDSDLFNAAMSSRTSGETAAVVAAYDFAGLGTIVDVAGGHGGLIAAILAASPGTRGVLFEQPHVIAGARSALQQRGIAGRCELVGGDMFAAVPPGGDVYLVKRTLHDWDDDRAAAILRNCCRAMTDGGRVLIIEMVIPPGNGPHLGKFYDLTMMVTLGGRERTEPEFAQLLAAAGLRLTRVVPTQSPLSIIESTRA